MMFTKKGSLIILLFGGALHSVGVDSGTIEIEETVVDGEIQRPLAEIFVQQSEMAFDPDRGIAASVDFHELIAESIDSDLF